jgi:hypothetical protein
MVLVDPREEIIERTKALGLDPGRLSVHTSRRAGRFHNAAARSASPCRDGSYGGGTALGRGGFCLDCDWSRFEVSERSDVFFDVTDLERDLERLRSTPTDIAGLEALIELSGTLLPLSTAGLHPQIRAAELRAAALVKGDLLDDLVATAAAELAREPLELAAKAERDAMPELASAYRAAARACVESASAGSVLVASSTEPWMAFSSAKTSALEVFVTGSLSLPAPREGSLGVLPRALALNLRGNQQWSRTSTLLPLDAPLEDAVLEAMRVLFDPERHTSHEGLLHLLEVASAL